MRRKYRTKKEEFLEFLKKEIRLFLVITFCVLSAKYLPDFFSFSGKSPMYEQYYHDSVPIGLLNLLYYIFIIRTVVAFIIKGVKLWRRKEVVRGT